MVTTENNTAQKSRSFTWALRLFLCLLINSLLFFAWLTYLIYFLKKMDYETFAKFYGLIYNANFVQNRERVNATEFKFNLTSKNK